MTRSRSNIFCSFITVDYNIFVISLRLGYTFFSSFVYRDAEWEPLLHWFRPNRLNITNPPLPMRVGRILIGLPAGMVNTPRRFRLLKLFNLPLLLSVFDRYALSMFVFYSQHNTVVAVIAFREMVFNVHV